VFVLTIRISLWTIPLPDGKEGEEYHVVHVLYLISTNKKGKGVELSEFDISDCVPYDRYRLDRFASLRKTYQKNDRITEHCTELDNIGIGLILENCPPNK
jgi:hypothetical protein